MTAHFPGLIYTPNTYIHDRSLSWIDIGTSIKSYPLMRFYMSTSHCFIYILDTIIFITIINTD
jgi:hypothetical protein